MRAGLLTIGAVLLLFGGYVLVQGLNVTTDKQVIKFGPLEGSVEEKKAVPSWLGALAAVAGVALIIGGVTNKSRS